MPRTALASVQSGCRDGGRSIAHSYGFPTAIVRPQHFGQPLARKFTHRSFGATNELPHTLHDSFAPFGHTSFAILSCNPVARFANSDKSIMLISPFPSARWARKPGQQFSQH
jgi:hypothetical protein